MRRDLWQGDLPVEKLFGVPRRKGLRLSIFVEKGFQLTRRSLRYLESRLVIDEVLAAGLMPVVET